MKHMGMQDNTLCDSRAQVKPITAMEGVGVMYVEPEVDEHSGPGMGEDSARSVRKLIISTEENSLAELSKSMKVMRKPDDSLLCIQ
jgi:hypothetical protein